ncbi:MAG TPA: type II toxin-antitoxin system RelE/ParE family toxin [Candidatus Methanoperedenaceae archaeon]|nr:type II toxin-antitoxin system RelE/ParE family toxin [Candidatus Methanoperedenaceae archaeon]
MTYRIVAHPEVQKEIKKLYKKDKVRYEYIKKKLKILSEQPDIGKPLRNVLKGKWRIQIGSFVLIYEIDNNDNKIILLRFEHHDNAYR